MSIRRSHKLMAALALASGALAACNLLTGLNADYSANAHDGAVAPAGEGGGDGPGGDGEGRDGAGQETSTPPDAGGDAEVFVSCAAAKGDSSPSDFFCSDFEGASFSGNTAPSPWTGMTNFMDGGVMMFSDDAGPSGSRVLDIIGTASGGNGVQSHLLFTFNPDMAANAYRRYEMRFDFRIVSSTFAYAAFGLLVFAPFTQAGEHGIAGYGPTEPTTLSHQGSMPGYVRNVTNDPLIWHRAKVTLERVDGGTTYMRTIFIDESNVEDDPSGHTINAGAPTELWVGISNAGAPGSARAQFDNVTLRRTP